ncbi:hypothetical protein ACN28I_45825 [Archangium gephyra]|uniref:hypothetical protein n=1 Tax=Archangium gephyra TaxID=48 RepID=UPI003B76D7D2
MCSSGSPPTPSFLDTIPGLLEEIRRSLHNQAEGREHPAPPAPEVPSPAAHQARRFPPGVNLDRLVREYGLLRECILELMAEGSATIDVQESRVLGRCLDAALKDTVTRYERQRDFEHEERQRQTQELVGSFSIAFDHLRSHLRIIRLMVSLPRPEEDPPERVQKRSQSLQRLAEDMERVLGCVAELERIERGLDPSRTAVPFDLGPLLDAILAQLREDFPTQPLQLETAGTLHGEWEPESLSVLLDSLSRLACALNPPGSPLTVALREEGDRIRIDVGRGESSCSRSRCPSRLASSG